MPQKRIERICNILSQFESIVDELLGFNDYQAARSYWSTLKNRLKEEGSESVTKCQQLKLIAADGKKISLTTSFLSRSH